MSLLSTKSIGKEIKNNILTLSENARIAKNNNPNVINATIGMLYDDNNKLYEFKTISKVEQSLSLVEKYAYASVTGGKDFSNAIEKWVFRDYLEEIKSKLHTSVIATPGGTGAISNTFSNYISENEYVLLPEYMWPAYKNMVREFNLKYETYNLFDLNDIKEKINKHKMLQNKVFFVLNDPCHNPTGYQLNTKEFKDLVDYINEVTKDNTPFIFLYDMAYIDFDFLGFDNSRSKIKYLTNINPSIMTVLAFSGSKTFSLYGLRIGAMIGLTKLEENIIEFYKSNEYSSRAKWSNTSKLGISLITKLINNKDYYNEYSLELEKANLMIQKRSEVLLNELNKYNIKYLPYCGGFFISIKVSNPVEIMNKLIEKDLYIIPMENTIRIAICSINENEIIRLVEILKEVL